MTNFLLVHGAWHGGWCWRRVSKLLRAEGHEVFTPTLTGLGEKHHLLSRDVGLDTHIDDVQGALEFEDLTETVLVGHSYAGMVITGVAERVPERLARLIYLDAFVPADGQSICDFRPPDLLRSYQEKVRNEGDGYMLNPPSADAFGIADEADRAWVGSKLTPHPFKTQEDRLSVRNPAAAELSKAYIYCDSPPAGPLDQFVEKIRADKAWAFRELHTGHDAMITEPERLTKMLIELTLV